MTGIQLPLTVGPRFQPLPLDSAHYVAALQTKPGELDALERATADTWSKFTPLIQIVGPRTAKKLINAANVTTWTSNVQRGVGQHTLFLDILRLKATHPVVTSGGVERPVLERIFWSARRRSLNFVPVIRVGQVG